MCHTCVTMSSRVTNLHVSQQILNVQQLLMIVTTPCSIIYLLFACVIKKWIVTNQEVCVAISVQKLV